MEDTDIDSTNLLFFISSFVAVALHSYLNFSLCGKFSGELRFPRISIFLVAAINGAVAPFIFWMEDVNVMVPYAICFAILISELFVLFKGKKSWIVGVGAGSLLHLFVIRTIIVAVFSLIFGISMHDVVTDPIYFQYLNLTAFVMQIPALIAFMKLIPVDTVRQIIRDKGFYNALLVLTLILNVYVIFNSNVFMVDVYSVTLVVQEIVTVFFALGFFYLALLFLIRIFNLGIYKKKTKELQSKIEKDRTITIAAFNSADFILEVNCTENKVTRMLVSSREKETEHLPTFDVFFPYYTGIYTHPEDVKLFEGIDCASLISSHEAGNDERIIEYRSRKAVPKEDGGMEDSGLGYFWYRMRMVTNTHENEITAVITIEEVDEEKKEELSLLRKAQTDPLTGALNKRTFEEKVTECLAKDVSGALLMFDLDNFKEINDNMGHAAGDGVLNDVYADMTSVFRSDDIIGRIGGDEFVAFLPHITSIDAIENKAKEICNRLNKTYTAQNGVNIEISSSVGIAFSSQDVYDYETLFNRADMAMYHSKNIGKNAYTVYSESSSMEYSPRKKQRDK